MTDETQAIVLRQLRRDEGIRLKPYSDTHVPPRMTIGYGRNLDDTGVTLPEAEYLLQNDANHAYAVACQLFPSLPTLNPARQAVLVEMAFNLGIVSLSAFHKMRECVTDGDIDGAANEMADSHWATEVGARAVRLEQQWRTGIEV